MLKPVLESEQYLLYMEGGLRYWKRSGSSEYHDYEDDYQAWEGEAVVIDKKTGVSVQFCCTTGSSRSEEFPRDPYDLVMRTHVQVPDEKRNTGWMVYMRDASAEEVAFPGMEEVIVNLICERFLQEVKNCEEPIKRAHIKKLAEKELVTAGIIADPSTEQISIPILSGT